MKNSARDAVVAAYQSWDAAFNRSDARAVSEAYHQNAKLLPPSHQVVPGAEGIRSFFAGLFDNGVSQHKLEIIEAGGDGGIAYGAAKWSAKAKDGDGKPQDVGGMRRMSSSGKPMAR